ncbi:hypothetical protein Bhyg_12033 [Pseudolycoriella hygida]|uniref:Uncharacterized protein n=1 Tax=Pseudolycoriella hygida TaxID=35572 RepID=A0A9Q0MY80_9DIPT|nr:hypothetical protein Bhyg_12033 [Pseudolycoriella hygida]
MINPITNAERKKRYIEKLKKDGKFEEFKEKNAAEQKKRRERLSAGFKAFPKHVRARTERLIREYNRKKVAEHRQRKRQQLGLEVVPTASNESSVETVKTDDGLYKTKSALAKAVAKVKRALPSTVPKKKQVVLKILKSFGPNGLEDATATIEKKGHEAVSKSDIAMDCRKFKNSVTGVKEYQQIRYLQYKLTDVYALFVKHIKEDNDENTPPVIFSKFCDLRPRFVKLVGETPLNQCLCLYHSNFMMCCAAIKKNIPGFPKYGSELEQLILCKDSNQNCWLRKCRECPIAKNVLEDAMKSSGKRKNKSVSWMKWVKDDTTNRFQKRSQHTSFEKDTEEDSNGEVAVLQVDLAENFLCEAQNEIQSAHWHQSTIIWNFFATGHGKGSVDGIGAAVKNRK